MGISSYDHRSITEKWHAYWAAGGYASSRQTADKTPYTIIMPPPNITGILHMGHVLNATAQDVLARQARMRGKEVCWVPGTDHASIATEAKVVGRLQAQGKSKASLGRDKFLQEVWKWKEEHENIILSQLKKLGVSCDWSRLAFTMDEARSASVIKTFVRLYEEGYIYRGMRMIHWDPKGKTALADEEVIYREVDGELYYIQYPIVGGQASLTIATTRPETLLGDTAICVHPEDVRYRSYVGKEAYVPLIKRSIPIIADDYVDPKFGTGVLKVTPAHDPHDYALGEKHNLARINIFDETGCLNEKAGSYAGLDRAIARKQIVADLDAAGMLVERKPYRHKVGFSERTNARVEPRISTQWFVRMEQLAQPAIEAVKRGTIKFHPTKFINSYLSWMMNIKEWCISRQLWWGHRIPVYFLSDGRYVVAESKAQALTKAQTTFDLPTLTLDDLRQDEDVLDTWFSSWLWPMSVFDGVNQSENLDFTYYYPTATLVTAPEIIFFWVARMIMAGYYYQNKPPFKDVYFTGIVRDKQGRKMSKSLGNSPDPLALMDQYSVDGVRAGILFASPAGNDLLFDEKLCQQGYQFVHKIYNAYLLVKSWQKEDKPTTAIQRTAITWFTAQHQAVLQQINKALAGFRLSEALMLIYRHIWDEFCAHYLEMIKPQDSKSVSQELYNHTAAFLLSLLKILHPFMPFVTEELWQGLGGEEGYTSIMVAPWPAEKSFDTKMIMQATMAFTLLKQLRHYRKKLVWSKDKKPTLAWQGPTPLCLPIFQDYISQQGGIAAIEKREGAIDKTHAFTLEGTTFWLVGLSPSGSTKQTADYRVELAHQERFLQQVKQKLGNARFMEKAPPHIITLEKKKAADAKQRIAALKALLDNE